MTDDLFTHAARYPSAPGHRDTDTSREAASDMIVLDNTNRFV